MEFFSRTLRKGATKTQAGAFLASKSGPGSSPSHTASSEIMQRIGDLDPFLSLEHFRHNPSPDHWERSPVLRRAVVSACGSAAGAGHGKPSQKPQLVQRWYPHCLSSSLQQQNTQRVQASGGLEPLMACRSPSSACLVSFPQPFLYPTPADDCKSRRVPTAGHRPPSCRPPRREPVRWHHGVALAAPSLLSPSRVLTRVQPGRGLSRAAQRSGRRRSGSLDPPNGELRSSSPRRAPPLPRNDSPQRGRIFPGSAFSLFKDFFA